MMHRVSKGECFLGVASNIVECWFPEAVWGFDLKLFKVEIVVEMGW
jgi:hypothetical protein